MATALLVAACGRDADPPPVDRPIEPASLAGRIRVLDGDTFSIDGRRVRLINADAPEPLPGARCPGEAIAAREAIAFAQEVVRDGRTLIVEPGGRMDQWGRRLTRVSIDGLDLGDTLHQAGYAARRGMRPYDWCGRLSAEGGPPLTSLLPKG